MRMAPVTLVLLLLAGCQSAPPPPPPTQPVPNARIPFFRLNIDDWKEEDGKAILIRTRDHRYYRAPFMGPCPDLPFATGVGFDTGGGDELDRFSAVLVEGRRCQFQELYEIPPVPGW
ncbi:MAG: hypothetical protein JWM77_3925 [Rhodospirillales bacterium]|jgi:hypothetical protein|nr:hypothetical protein [Rhodospirillales bacterium]